MAAVGSGGAIAGVGAAAAACVPGLSGSGTDASPATTAARPALALTSCAAATRWMMNWWYLAVSPGHCSLVPLEYCDAVDWPLAIIRPAIPTPCNCRRRECHSPGSDRRRVAGTKKGWEMVLISWVSALWTRIVNPY